MWTAIILYYAAIFCRERAPWLLLCSKLDDVVHLALYPTGFEQYATCYLLELNLLVGAEELGAHHLTINRQV